MTAKMEPNIAPMVNTERWWRLCLSVGPFSLEGEALESVRVVAAVYVVVIGSPSLIRVWVMVKGWKIYRLTENNTRTGSLMSHVITELLFKWGVRSSQGL